MLRSLMVDPRKLALRLVIAQQRFELIDDGEDPLRLAIRSRSIRHIYIEGEVRPHRGMHPGEKLRIVGAELLCSRQKQEPRREHRYRSPSSSTTLEAVSALQYVPRSSF